MILSTLLLIYKNYIRIQQREINVFYQIIVKRELNSVICFGIFFGLK